MSNLSLLIDELYIEYSSLKVIISSKYLKITNIFTNLYCQMIIYLVTLSNLYNKFFKVYLRKILKIFMLNVHL